MATLSKTVLAATIAAGALALSSAAASAAIACRGNVCWHVHEHYTYPGRARIVVHEDDWHPHGHITFREHEGRGYWRGGTWVAW